MQSKTYRPDVDGLRGLAVFSVVAYHAGLPFFDGGFVGVDIFFVISGYLICSIIHREVQEQRFSFATFYARRVKRILPALFAVLLFCYALAILMLTQAEMKDFSRSAVANIVGASNIYFWKSINYFSPSAELKPLMMTWSLSVEEQFYLFFPFVLLIIRRFGWPLFATIAIMTVVSLAASIWMTAHNPSMAFFLLPARAWELGAGALLSIHESRHGADALASRPVVRDTLGWIGIAMLAAGVLFYEPSMPFPGLAAALPVVGAVLAIAAKDSLPNRVLLAYRPLVFIGLVSYSWYLWHWPLLAFARLASDQPLTLPVTASLAVLAFIVAVLSWRYVEQPFRRGSHDATRTRATLARYAVAAGCMLAIGATLIVGRGWPQRLPASFVALEDSAEIHYDPCLANYGDAAPSLSAQCVATAPGATLALIGDSHASALAPAVRELAGENGMAYAQFTKSSCPALSGVTRFMPAHPGHDAECAQFNTQALQRIAASPDIGVVVFAGYWSAPFDDEENGQRYIASDKMGRGSSLAESRRYLASGMEETVRVLSAAGKRVILVKDVPMFDFDPVRAVAAASIPARGWLASQLSTPASRDGSIASVSRLRNDMEISRRFIDNLAAKYPNVRIADPRRQLCDAEHCRFRDDSDLYYVDFQHVSFAGADQALRSFSLSGSSPAPAAVTPESLALRESPDGLQKASLGTPAASATR